MEVEVITEELIKPSLPTPHHLKTHKVSLLDQFIPPTYTPLVLFYPTSDIRILKTSLSETLTRFYPLAGKIKDEFTIDCNDEGARFIEARVNGNLSEFLDKPRIPSLCQFVPGNASWLEGKAGNYVSMIQANKFDCGGLALGIYIFHKVVDGTSLSVFLKSWAATALGNSDEALSPNFSAPILFPYDDSLPSELAFMSLWKPQLKFGKSVTKRFVFDAKALNVLKAEATGSDGKIPSRVLVVSALIWKCSMAAFKENRGYQKPCFVSHAVNLRPKAEPKMPETTLGNNVWLAVAKSGGGDCELELKDLIYKQRKAIEKVNSEFVKGLQGKEGFANLCEALKELIAYSGTGADYVGFTSVCNSGLYNVDFGWGKPMWVTGVGSTETFSAYLHFNFIGETRFGDGIEAWVTLGDEDMAIFERNHEILKYTIIDPSPLKLGKFDRSLTHDNVSF